MIDHPVPSARVPEYRRVSSGEYGWRYFDEPGEDPPNDHPRAANELTITEWDPVSKQPLFKAGAVKVKKVADSEGTPSRPRRRPRPRP